MLSKSVFGDSLFMLMLLCACLALVSGCQPTPNQVEQYKAAVLRLPNSCNCRNDCTFNGNGCTNLNNGVTVVIPPWGTFDVPCFCSCSGVPLACRWDDAKFYREVDNYIKSFVPPEE